MKEQTPLSRAHGLGAAHSGVHHFWVQRLTAVALVPLIIWFLVSLLGHAMGDYDSARAFLAQPLAAALLLLLIGAGFYHMKLGVQVVIEDYIHTESTKVALLMLNTFCAIAVGLVCALAVLKLFVAG